MDTNVKTPKKTSSKSTTSRSKTPVSGIRVHPLPPKGFDARNATPSTLKSYGLPQRPDPKKFPEQAAHWDKVFSKEMTFISPEFKPMEELIPGIQRQRRPMNTANSNDSIWSGSVVTTPNTNQFKSISGLFNVADVAPPSGTAGSYYMVTWIGIDGYGTSDVCQIGTVQAATLASNGTVSKTCYAWTEWYPQSWIGIANFPVNFGDTISALLCINSPTQAGFNMFNETSLIHTGFTFTAPAGTSLLGTTAEWIVERPGIGGSTSNLASFGDVYFDGATASTPNSSLHAGSGILLNMVEGSTTVTTTTVENTNLIKITSDF